MIMKKSAIFNCVGESRMIFPTFVFILLSFFNCEASEINALPDFAFPQTVRENNDSIMKSALKADNAPLALRSAMNISIANSLLGDNESIQQNITLLDSLALKLKGNYQSLAFLLEGEILYQAFSRNESVYNSRKLLLDSAFPTDPTEWSGEMYRTRILELVHLALESISDRNEGIKNIAMLLTDTGEAERIGLTVQEFILFKAQDLLRNIIGDRTITLIPFFPEEETKSIEGQCRTTAKWILNDIITKVGEGNSIVKALAMTRFCSLLNSDQRESYLKDAIEGLRSSEGEGILLHYLWDNYSQEKSSLYGQIITWLGKFPEGYGAKQLKYAIDILSAEKVEVKLPGISLPQSTIKGEVKVNNANRIYLLIYKLTSAQIDLYDNLILKNFSGSGKPVEIIEVNEEGKIPYEYSKEIEIKGLNEGVYVVIPSLTRNLPSGWSKSNLNAIYSTFRVSDIAILTSYDRNVKNSGKVYVVKGKNQQPVEGAIVKYFATNNPKEAPVTLKTNHEGWIKIPAGYYRIEASYGKSQAIKEAGFNYYRPGNIETFHTSILTDLSVYKPGDTIQYAVVGWKQVSNENQLLKQLKVKINLRDANNVVVGTDTLELDETGRANGHIEIPQGRLLGSWMLTASYPDEKNSGNSGISILVEEYKLPGFLVKLEQDTISSDSILKFTGYAMTYSGMPVSDAKVLVDVTFNPWRWDLFGSKASYSCSATTDSKGEFSIELPIDNLKGTVFDRGRYLITAEVTSPAGETQKSLPMSFYLGQGFNVRPQIPDKIEVKSNAEIKFFVPVYDMANLPVEREVKYTITKIGNEGGIDSDITMSGSFQSPNLEVPSINLSSGKYKFQFQTDDENIVETETVIWRPDDKTTPYLTPLWLPETEFYYTTDQNTISVPFGCFPDEWILCVLSDGEKELKNEWIHVSNGMTCIEIPIPSVCPTLFLDMAGLYDFDSVLGKIKIEPAKNKEKLEISTESFRDKISSGDEENWCFKFNKNGKGVDSVNAFAVLTDQALNAIKDFKWNLNIWKPGIYDNVYLNVPNYYPGTTFKSFSVIPAYPGSLTPLPEWETFGYPFVAYGRRINGPVYYKTMAMRGAKNEMQATDDSVAVTETQEEMAMEADSANTGGVNESEVIELRPMEMPMAFFKPNLKSNDDGEVALNFTVPNYNTTWQLQLAGYDATLKTASIVLDAVASKPLMVKTNMPSFLRTGDRAEISATIYNNTDSVLCPKMEMEIFDPYTGIILKTEEMEGDEINPSGNQTFELNFEVPANCNLIAVKVVTKTHNYSDGEQGYIVILPSSTPVIESKTFYASSNDELIEFRVPKMKKGYNVTLKYNDNPLWDVLLSLPVIRETVNNSSLNIAEWLYATMLSSHIIENDQAIKEGLKRILSSNDSTLTQSNLQKNQTFKLAALEATPWVNDAEAETSRMRSLIYYFNEKLVETQINEKIRALEKMQQSDGGWTWFEGMKSSSYITARIIAVLGYLNQYGLLTPELEKMADKAVKYYDAYLINERKRNKSINVSQIMSYLYSRNGLNARKTDSFKRIEAECFDSITKQWRHWGLGEKALGALVLNSSGMYSDEVKIISESLKQFLGKSIPLDEEAIMLRLYSVIGENSVIENIREKMFLQKETQNWGGDALSVGVIHALMTTSSTSVTSRKTPLIKVDDKPIVLSESQALAGTFTIDFDPEKISGKKVIIERSGGMPAWGGVIYQYISPIKDIKAEKMENLSIEKQVYVQDSAGKLKEVSEFKKGDKVTVVLNLSCFKDMEYVALIDSRAACLKSDTRTSGMRGIEGIPVYQEIGKDKISFFIENLPKGKYVIEYTCHADRKGDYSLGISSVQCLYSPAQTAHSAGSIIKVE